MRNVLQGAVLTTRIDKAASGGPGWEVSLVCHRFGQPAEVTPIYWCANWHEANAVKSTVTSALAVARALWEGSDDE